MRFMISDKNGCTYTLDGDHGVVSNVSSTVC